MKSSTIPTTVLSRGSWVEHNRIQRILAAESSGGYALVLAAALALVLANSPLTTVYEELRDLHLGFVVAGIDLNLSIGHWASDGLLTVFFFLAGLELKQEVTRGDLRDPGKAVVPVAAAFGGVAVPAAIYTAVNLASRDGQLQGWAIPSATDIAFAVAILGLLGTHLPSALRTFLLTLAIVDDLIAIVIIAVFYSSDLRPELLALALVPIAAFALVARRGELLVKRNRWVTPLVLLPIALLTWVLFVGSGVHATIAGVVLAFTVPVAPRRDGDPEGLAATLEHRVRPFSAGFAVPVFAFFSAGVAVGGLSGLIRAASDPILLGVVFGLVVGKPVGIVVTTFLVTRVRRVNLDPDIRWIDLVGTGALAGIGFTVSLLVAELSFGLGSPHDDAAKVGVLGASVLASLVGALILAPRNRRYRGIEERERADADGNGIPDAFEG